MIQPALLTSKIPRRDSNVPKSLFKANFIRTQLGLRVKRTMKRKAKIHQAAMMIENRRFQREERLKRVCLSHLLLLKLLMCNRGQDPKGIKIFNPK
jgi:hypothetical protein